MAAIASFVAGPISVDGVMLIAVPLSELGVRFGPFLILFLPPLLRWLRARSVRKGLPLAPKVQE